VYVEVEQVNTDPKRLLPGQFVLGRVRTKDNDKRVVLPRRAVQGGYVFVASEDSETNSLVIERVAVRAGYGFDGQISDLDDLETQWVTLELGHEPKLGSAVVTTLLDQLEVGMRVQLESDEGGTP
jgi:hypothetical protein